MYTNFMKNFTLITLVGFLFLTGCASLSTRTPAPSPIPETQVTQNRETTLAQLSRFSLDGAIGIKAPNDSMSAALNWEQINQGYAMSLYGPLASGSFHLRGKPGNVVLSMSDGKVFTAKSPEALLLAQTGWDLPVSNLYYWIKGLPVPGVASQPMYDNAHRLTSLSQSGWTIHYMRYTTVNHLDLPNKIVLENSKLTIKLVINQWRV